MPWFLDWNKLSFQLVLSCFCATQFWVSDFCRSFIMYVLACWCFIASAEENVQLFTATQASSSACQKHSELWIGLLISFFFQSDPCAKKKKNNKKKKTNPNLLSKLLFDLLLLKVLKGTKFQFNSKEQNKPITTISNCCNRLCYPPEKYWNHKYRLAWIRMGGSWYIFGIF